MPLIGSFQCRLGVQVHALLRRVCPFVAIPSAPIVSSVSKVHGVWLVGIIDEMRLLKEEKLVGSKGRRLNDATDVGGGRGRQAKGHTVRIVDTKTRYTPTPPREGQKRNSR